MRPGARRPTHVYIEWLLASSVLGVTTTLCCVVFASQQTGGFRVIVTAAAVTVFGFSRRVIIKSRRVQQKLACGMTCFLDRALCISCGLYSSNERLQALFVGGALILLLASGYVQEVIWTRFAPDAEVFEQLRHHTSYWAQKQDLHLFRTNTPFSH